ncbi:hypothetical protein [Pseudomonas typographi]|uniref:Uncharacterized protein n=1 Tax=Pseudomonas typographi TaxID=2715964 RepID=A0ABR7ZB23_9PSED|nr:hypothetical protein [Pseudomonas typographi]MBD1602499.1 hypothetical protein [Pseudomonas typographi]
MSRNIQTREGYEFWDRLCAIPNYGFLLSPEGDRVVKAEGVGNWIDQHDAQAVVDDAQSEINVLRDLLPVLVEARKVIATALKHGAPDWFDSEENIAEHTTIKRIDAAIAKATT